MTQSTFVELLKRHPRKLSWSRLVMHLAIDLSLISFAILCGRLNHFETQTVIRAFLFAIFSFRSFGLMHECVHGAGASNRSVNRMVGEFAGVFCFLPFRSWRDLHLSHHQWTGNVEKDPSMKLLSRFRQSGFKMPGFVSASWRFWIPLLGFMQHLVFWKATVSRKEFVFILGSIAYAAALWRFIGPLAMGAGFLIYLYAVEVINFPHHLGFRQYDGESRFTPREQMQFARSCRYPKLFANVVLLNFNLHTEHHLFPAHPWYQLDAIHADLVALNEPLNVSEGNAWIVRNRPRPIDQVFAETFETPGSGELPLPERKAA